MTTAADDKIKEFLASFDGDIAAARVALDNYEQQRNSDTKIKQNLLDGSPDKYKQPNSTGAARQPQLASDEIISVQQVSKRYTLGKQTVDALRGVSLSIGKGELVAITGASGSGKSTLLQIIGCLDKPTSGRVVVESKETTHLNDNALSELRQHAIGFIFQSFYLQPFLRLNDNLAVPAMFTHEKKKDIDARVDKLLQQVGLTERAKHFPKELSGGQIQRAAIARALVNNPRIILADEPTGNLDSVNSRAIIDLFRTIRDELGTTIIVVTHDREIASQADRIIELKDGVVV